MKTVIDELCQKEIEEIERLKAAAGFDPEEAEVTVYSALVSYRLQWSQIASRTLTPPCGRPLNSRGTAQPSNAS